MYIEWLKVEILGEILSPMRLDNCNKSNISLIHARGTVIPQGILWTVDPSGRNNWSGSLHYEDRCEIKCDSERTRYEHWIRRGRKISGTCTVGLGVFARRSSGFHRCPESCPDLLEMSYNPTAQFPKGYLRSPKQILACP